MLRAKCEALQHCVGFMDGTVIGIARPGCYAEQKAACSGQKRKHALGFQTITAPDGLLLHADSPIEGRRRDRALYVPSEIEQQLSKGWTVHRVQHYMRADGGYNLRLVVDVPFQGASMNAQKLAVKKKLRV